MENLSVENWVEIAGIEKAVMNNCGGLASQLIVAITEVMETYEALIDLVEGYPFKTTKAREEIVDGLADTDWMVKNIKYLTDGDIDLSYIYSRIFDKVKPFFGDELEFLVELKKKQVLISNYSKFCSSYEEVEKSVRKYREIGVKVEYNIVKMEDKTLFVLFSPTHQIGDDGKDYPEGKILKSINFVEPSQVEI